MKEYAIRFMLILLLSCANHAFAQTTAFTFQGRLKAANVAADGSYDMQFKLFDSVTVGAGVQQGITGVVDPVAVSAGTFSVTLDFGAAVFDGAPRFLEIGVRPSGSADPYTVLGPRNPITSVPYAVQALNAQQLGGLPASAFISTGSVGNAFVKNGTTPQTATNFNIDGKGQIGGSLGIGTTPVAGVSLDVAGSARVTPNGGTVSLTAPNGEVGIVETFGTGRADLRFDGKSIKLLAGPAGGPPALTQGLVVNTNGQVLIGTDDIGSNVKMFVTGGSDQYGILVQEDHPLVAGIGANVFNGNAPAVDGENWTTGDGVYGLSNTGVGVRGASTYGFGVYSSGYLGITKLGTAGNTALCLNASLQVATCSSSLRYKKSVQAFDDGLAVVDQLQPIAFTWKTDDLRDVGFGAEDVAKINPLFITHNSEGEIEGVRYDRLSVVFVNAFKQQQAQIRSQVAQIQSQSAEIDLQKTRIESLQSQFERQQKQLEQLQRAIGVERVVANSAD